MVTRVVEGRAGVVREVRAAAPLLAALSAPVTARGPWLAAALHVAPVPVPPVRPRAVVVEAARGRPVGAALLTSRTTLHRGRPLTLVRLLGDEGDPGPSPVPHGVAPRRLAAADPDVAARLAAGIADLLRAVRGPWQLRLTGLPLGDPVLAALAAELGVGASFATTRSRRLVDHLDAVGPVRRGTDPAGLERWLPALLAHRPPGSGRARLRALARVHAAVGSLEHAVVLAGDRPVAGLLTLLDGGRRLPWWGFGGPAGPGTAPGQPWVSLTAASADLNR